MNRTQRLTPLAVAAGLLMAAAPLCAQDRSGGTAPPREGRGADRAVAAPAAPVAPGVYASDIHDDRDMGTSPAAINIVGARGGAFNGKVVVVLGEGAKGLKAGVSDLKQGEAVIPASRIQVRYGQAWADSIGSFQRPVGRDILLDSSEAVSPAGKAGSVVPVWVTVSVPKEAKAGVYAGQMTIEGDGRKLADVPVKVSVGDWVVPEPRQWKTWVELVQSPDTLAVEYGVPLWSERHWKMIGQSLRYIGQVGGDIAYVPLVARTNLGNEESMVRWVRKGEGRYDYDFTVMDKYLDLVQENMGNPEIVCFWVWDVYLNPPPDKYTVPAEGDSQYSVEEKGRLGARNLYKDKGPPVTVFDPSTGKTEVVCLPKYSDPAGKALWAALWKAIRERMAKRGLEKAMMLGVISDWWPTKEDAQALYDVSGGLPWVSCSHHCRWRDNPTGAKKALLGIGDVGYTTLALSFRYTINPALGRTWGWQKPVLHSQYWRSVQLHHLSLSGIRHEAECQITGEQRGLGRLGADFWYCIQDKRGRRGNTVTDRYTEVYWHNLNIYNWHLAPGPEGPVGTARLELIREGVQECEARIAIETVLTDPALKAKLGGDLAERAQKFLDEQQLNLWRAKGAGDDDLAKYGNVDYSTYYNLLLQKWKKDAGNAWFVKNAWAERVGQLYALADEVQKKTAN